MLPVGHEDELETPNKEGDGIGGCSSSLSLLPNPPGGVVNAATSRSSAARVALAVGDAKDANMLAYE